MSYPESGRASTRIDSGLRRSRSVGHVHSHVHTQHTATHRLATPTFEAPEPPVEPLRRAYGGSEPGGSTGSAVANHWHQSFGAGPESLNALEVAQKPEVFQESVEQLPPTP